MTPFLWPAVCLVAIAVARAVAFEFLKRSIEVEALEAAHADKIVLVEDRAAVARARAEDAMVEAREAYAKAKDLEDRIGRLELAQELR